MANPLDFILSGLGSSDSIKDYGHASRIFVDGNFVRSPKYSFLFYVVFEYHQTTSGGLAENGTLESPTEKVAQLGALCKSAQLPKFTIENKVLNAYNRKNIVQTGIKYDPISLKFHDDSSDIVRDFWYDYMSFYYRDSDYSEALYNRQTKYLSRDRDQWGFGLRPQSMSDASLMQGYNPIASVSIYSFTRNRFSQYKIMNPIITAFRHGEHTMEGTNLLEHEMTLTYEAVKYYKGNLAPAEFGNFLLLYDNQRGPLSRGGGVKSVFGQGGLVDTADAVVNDLAAGNIKGAFLKINQTAQTFKNVNFGDLITAESSQAVNQAIRQGVNPSSTVNAPSIGDINNSSSGLAILATAGLVQAGSDYFGSQGIEAGFRATQYTPSIDQTAQPNTGNRVTSGNDAIAPQQVIQGTRIDLFPGLVTTASAGNKQRLSNDFSTGNSKLPANTTLNQAPALTGGTQQGNATGTGTAPAPLAEPFSPAVISMSLVVLTDELTNPVPTDARRVNWLQYQVNQLLASDTVTSSVRDDPTLLTARDAILYEASHGYPPIGTGFTFNYNTQTQFDDAKTRFYNEIGNRLPTPTVEQNTINKFIDIKTQLNNPPSSEAEVRNLFVQAYQLLNDKTVQAAYQKVIDVKGYQNYYVTLLNTPIQKWVTKPDSDFWIQG